MIEVSNNLYRPNCRMFRLIQDKWGDNNPLVDFFTLEFKPITIAPIEESLQRTYDEHPGFGGHADIRY